MTDLSALADTADRIAFAAALMREQHGPDCADRDFWAATADLLDKEAANARATAQPGPWLVGDCAPQECRYAHVLRVARAYLTAHAPAAGTEVAR